MEWFVLRKWSKWKYLKFSDSQINWFPIDMKIACKKKNTFSLRSSAPHQYAYLDQFSVIMASSSFSSIHLKPSINPNPPLGSPLCAAAGYLKPLLTLDRMLDKYLQLKNHKANGRPKLSVLWQWVYLSGLTAANYSAQVTSYCQIKKADH